MDLADATGAETSLFNKGRLLVATPTDESAPDLNIGTGRSLRNEGQADLSAKNLQVAGTVEIAGFTLYKGMNLVAGGANKVLEGGYEKGDNLTVNAGGTQTVEAGKQSIWKQVEITLDGVLDTAGQLKSDEIKIDGGILTTTCGETETGSLDITNKRVPVIGTDNRFDDRINAPELLKSADKVVVGKTVNFTQEGGLSVGHDQYDLSEPEATIGSLVFGRDSGTVLIARSLNRACAFHTDDSMKAFLEDGPNFDSGQY